MTNPEQGPADAQTQSRLRALLRSFGQSLAHDLGGPARKARAFGEMLGQDLGSSLDPAVAESLRCLDTSLDQLTTRLERVTLWCRLPETPGSQRTTPLQALLLRAREMRPGITWATQGSGEGLTGDPELWALLLAELLHNALVYAPGTVPEVRWDGATGELTIRDYGKGLDGERCREACEPFRRFVGATEIPGTGLGLTIAARVAEMHGVQLALSHADPGLLVRVGP